MKNKFYFLLALLLCCLATQARADLVGIEISGNSTGCPNETGWYSAYTNINTTWEYTFEVTGGTIIGHNQLGAKPAPGTTSITFTDMEYFIHAYPAIEVKWNNGSGTGKIKVSTRSSWWGIWNSRNDAEKQVVIGTAQVGPIYPDYMDCSAGLVTFRIASVQGATRYDWSCSEGWPLTYLEAGGCVARFVPNTNATTGTVTVTAYNGNCPLTSTTSTVTFYREPTIAQIAGPYAIPLNSVGAWETGGGSNYNWTIPSDWQIVGGLGTNRIQLQAPSYTNSRLLSVSYIDACGQPISMTITINAGDQEPYRPAKEEEETSSTLTQNLEVYPVPATDVINFSLPASEGTVASAKLYTMQGQLVVEYKKESLTSIATKNLPRGAYFLVVTNNKGTSTKKKVLLTN
ncbi:T9SS type A sorting domain-containing protein [Hymenobacter cellulosivorans]|uniref:T9SS type A sorting domain-containing protein n=1 Tax=Hymenobacter cellulosivorans TaxID=2932249 RepID=A0ABY4FHB8_9BACT|nr:T9SS type A sorting domain-containing protein [Hymenobacter cellulosivorans]UOQ53861.1 T9SS type A sorting domain-containing protein [Hymenobacter cellulosivorans]